MNAHDFDHIREQIRDANPLEEVARSYLSLPSRGTIKTLCPFHSEKTPSFSLHPSGEFFKCFGCGETADVFSIVERFENTDFRGSMEFLAKRANIPLPDNWGQDGEVIVKHLKTKQREEELLESVLDIIRTGSAADFSYLEGRGISKEVCEKYEIYSCDLNPQQLRARLKEKNFDDEVIESSGILVDSRFFEKSLVFPIRKRGKIVTLCSRTLENRDPKYLYLKNHPRGIFNFDEAVGQREIIITEAPLDALSLISNGFTNSVSLGGCLASEDQTATLKKLSNKTFYICFDNDADKERNAGLEAAIDLAKELEAKIIVLPSEDNKKIDVNDFFVSGSNKDDFNKLKEGAKEVPEAMVSQIPQGTPKVRLREALDSVFDYLADREELDANNHIRHTIAPYFKLNSREINDYIKHLRKIQKERSKAKSIQPELKDKAEDKDDEIPEELKNKALEVLRSPNLLYQVLCTIKRVNVVGEEKNVLIIYLVGTSRITDEPLSATLKAESAAGKSYTTSSVFKLFPEAAFVDLTDATAQSFYYVPKDYFAHRIIIIFERHGQEKSDYSIRSLQSEQKLKLQVTTKDKDTGQFVTKVKEVDGPVGFITTTTEPRIHDENETRNISVYVDEGKEQTSGILEAINSKYMGVAPIDKEEIEVWQTIQKILKPYPVVIPFANELSRVFPKEPLRVRRDYSKFLALVSVNTLLHQEQREKVEIEGREYLKATLVDFHLAKAILEDTLTKTIYELPPKSEQLLLKAKDLILRKDPGVGVTIRELSGALGWDYDTAKKWSEPAFQKGYLTVVEEHKGAKAAKYEVSDKKLEERRILPKTEELYEIDPGWLGDGVIYDPINGEELVFSDSGDSTDVPMEKEKEKIAHAQAEGRLI